MQKLFSSILLLGVLSACMPAQTRTQISATPSGIETADTQQTPVSTSTPHPTSTDTPTPTHTFTPSATPEPTPRRGSFINIFCLQVTQSIEDSQAVINEPISETLGRVLAGAGLVFITGSESCDAVLRLDFTFMPKGYRYQVEGSEQLETCYTGAALRGTADLTWQGSSLFHRDLQGEFIPADGASSCPPPEGAPYGRVWPGVAMAAMAEIWGKNVLVPALIDPYRVVRDAGAQSLPLLSVEELLAFLPFLNTLLQDSSEVVRLRTAEALQRCAEHEAVMDLTPSLITALEAEQHPETAQALVNLLVETAGKRGMDSAILPAFVRILENSQPCPQDTPCVPGMMILNGLQQFGPAALEAVPVLISLLENAGDTAAAGEVRAALMAVSGEDYGLNAQAWQAWWENR